MQIARNPVAGASPHLTLSANAASAMPMPALPDAMLARVLAQAAMKALAEVESAASALVACRPGAMQLPQGAHRQAAAVGPAPLQAPVSSPPVSLPQPAGGPEAAFQPPMQPLAAQALGAGGVPSPAAAEARRLHAISVLGRHEGQFDKGLSVEQIQEKIGSEKTPPDLRQALQIVLADPELKRKVGDHLDAGDIHKLQSSPEAVAYSQHQAKSFTRNYVPSDGGAPAGRVMTANDAQRELYKYSDYLPKDISRDTLQGIVDGTSKMGKCPPQLIAAAQYFLDSPEDWQEMTGKGPNDSISQAGLNDRIAGQLQWTPREAQALAVMDANQDTFFKGGHLTRDRLKEMLQDEKLAKDKPEVIGAAHTLLTSPVLFGVLDNAAKGHHVDYGYSVDDGKISRHDFNSFMAKHPQVAPPEPMHAPASVQDVAALDAMQCGTLNQPDIKQVKPEKVSGFRKFLSGFLGIFSKMADIGSTVMGTLASLKIPGFAQVAAVGALGASGISGVAKVASAGVDGGDVKGALKEGLINFGLTAATTVAPPGAGATGKTAEQAKNAAKVH